MIRRRLIAILSSLTMLHLSVVSGESACASPAMVQHHAAMTSSADASESERLMSGHAMPMEAVEGAESATHGGSAGTTGSAGVPPCEIPTPQHCCGALVGCSVSIAITDATQVIASTVLPAARIRVALHDAPASFAPAPEPPPPKA